MSKNIILIIGTRPNFMKALPVYEVLKNHFNLILIHTGQHFDTKMSDVFFNQLKFPRPDIHLTLEKKTKSGDFDNKLYINNQHYLQDKDKVIRDLMMYDGDLGQLGEIRDKLKIEFQKIDPDLVIVCGDVTSTLAGAIAAKALNINIAHLESGLRSGDIKMPEEINRILTDHISKYYFVTEQSGVDNLKKIGITNHVYLVGNTMIDTQKKYLNESLNTKYNEILGLKNKEYVLITLHRPSNVDNIDKLKQIFDDLQILSKTETLIYPIHPRTEKNLKKIDYLEKIKNNVNFILEKPLGYLEFTCLMTNSKYVITDSGGIQEETTSLDIPCFTLRENTERPSTLIENYGTNQLINRIDQIKLIECTGRMEIWKRNSSSIILSHIYKIMNKQNNTLLLFDVDGTLTHPRKKIESNMISCLEKLKKKYTLGFVGGSDVNKQIEQLGENNFELFTWRFSENGLLGYHEDKCIHKRSFVEALGEEHFKKLINICLHVLSETDCPIKRGTFIEYRNGMLNVSPVGRACTQEERDHFNSYDIKYNIRESMIENIQNNWEKYLYENNLNLLKIKFSIGGQISFDVFPEGWDKTYCLQFIKEQYDEIHFFGDKTHKGGNDFEIYNDSRVIGHHVDCYEDTIKLLNKLF